MTTQRTVLLFTTVPPEYKSDMLSDENHLDELAGNASKLRKELRQSCPNEIAWANKQTEAVNPHLLLQHRRASSAMCKLVEDLVEEIRDAKAQNYCLEAENTRLNKQLAEYELATSHRAE